MPKHRLFAEACGTFAIVFAGTGAIIIDGLSGGAITHVGVALTFGLIVFAMVDALGDVSGAHLNPAVTLAFVLDHRFSLRAMPGYVLAQCLGAIAASSLLRVLFPASTTLGATIPRGDPVQSFILELVITFLLMLVILRLATGAKERGASAALAIGAAVAAGAMFAGPVSGASMNPARSLAPALVTGGFSTLWLYIVAPCLGAALAVPAHALLADKPVRRVPRTPQRTQTH